MVQDQSENQWHNSMNPTNASRLMLSIFVLTLTLTDSSRCRGQEENYPVPPEAETQEGVPRGRIEGPFEFRSQIYPGTVRNYWVYIPAQYDPSRPPALIIVQDGLRRAEEWRLPIVLDNMIHAGQIPVQLGVFVDHGQVPVAATEAQPRFNRSFEYDSLGDTYARFLTDELLPEVSQTWKFSERPDDRCLAGASSGGICAFNAAWERPDAFRRVLCTIGTFVALRGGDAFPGLVRKVEPKPIRVFLQDGSQDLDIYAGSWWHANQSMLSALQYAGYEVQHAWAEGGHNGKHGAAVLPEALRFLWRDYPQPLKAGKAREPRVDILIEGQDWELVSSGHAFTEGPAVNAAGELFFTDIPNKRIHKVSLEGSVTQFAENTGSANGLMFGADGLLYACRTDDAQIVRYQPDGSRHDVFVTGIRANDIVILPDGSGYCTEPDTHKVWFFDASGRKQEVDSGIAFPNGLMTSPDQALLNVSDTQGRFVYSFRIGQGGKLEYKQKYGWLHVTDELQSHADGMAVDTEGRLYVTTAAGLQVLDQLGRVNLIIRKPGATWLSNVVFAGPARDVLVVTCGDSVYRRRVGATGADPWKPPVNPPKPRL